MIDFQVCHSEEVICMQIILYEVKCSLDLLEGSKNSIVSQSIPFNTFENLHDWNIVFIFYKKDLE